jgi:hypothetical protein
MNRPTRFYSNKQEKSVAKVLHGKQTANSGATAFSKGDVRTDLFLIECKTTTEFRKSMSVKREWIEKNKEEAFAMNKPYSAVAIDFGDGENFYIIDEKLFTMLNAYLAEGEK